MGPKIEDPKSYYDMAKMLREIADSETDPARAENIRQVAADYESMGDAAKALLQSKHKMDNPPEKGG